MILLDTSALVECLGEHGALQNAFRRRLDSGERMALPTLVLYEWLRGPRTARELELRQQLLPDADSVPLDAAAAALAAQLYRRLPHARSRALDLAVAACALCHGAALWTLNHRDFADVPDLRLI